MKKTFAAIAMIAGLAALSACSTSSSTPAASSGGSSTSSTATKLVFNADGTPNLNGLTINVGNAAGSAHTGDTNVYDLVQTLKKWGANASQTNASGNAPELAAASGKIDVAVGPLPTEVDSGLNIFGPNQARLDEVILAKDSVANLAGMKGQSVAICCDASPDGVLLNKVLSTTGLKQSDMSLLRTGASAASLSALIAGRVDVAFVHTSDAATAGAGFHVLANAASVLPQYADSFMASTPAWLKANPGLAEAIDLAWLASAKLFNTSESTWVTNAATYTSNADNAKAYQTSWTQLQSIEGWPTMGNVLTASAVNFNISIAGQQQALKGAGTRPAVQEMDLSPWQAAWAQFSAHESAY